MFDHFQHFSAISAPISLHINLSCWTCVVFQTLLRVPSSSLFMRFQLLSRLQTPICQGLCAHCTSCLLPWLKPLSTRGWHFLAKDNWLKLWNFLCTSCRHAVATVEVEGGDQNILSFTEFGEWWTDRSPLFNIMAEKIGVACLYAVTCRDIAWLSQWCIKKSVTCFQNTKVPRCLVAG